MRAIAIFMSIVFLLTALGTTLAQEAPVDDGASQQLLDEAALDQLVAPIALYPDPLLSQVLIASTYPLEVVQAERWAEKNKELKGDALDEALAKEDWDDTLTFLLLMVTFRLALTLDVDGLSPPPYAQRIVSSPGKKDGLYWPSTEGESPSPLGELFAEASAEGYKLHDKPIPYHGYYYRILKRQGADANGGEFDYVVNGRMIGGFGLIAYPAEYGNSGIMTFMVNHDGVVFQKDLGPETSGLARKIATFLPDSTWTKVDAP